MEDRRWGIAAVLAALAISSPAGCRHAGAPRAAEDDAGVERDIAAALEAERDAEAPSAEPPSPQPPGITCGGWVGSSSPESCLYLWSSCSDGLNRQMRCQRADEGYDCMCLTGLRTPIHFHSADICVRDTGVMSIDRARSSAIARGACGFEVHE